MTWVGNSPLGTLYRWVNELGQSDPQSELNCSSLTSLNNKPTGS